MSVPAIGLVKLTLTNWFIVTPHSEFGAGSCMISHEQKIRITFIADSGAKVGRFVE